MMSLPRHSYSLHNYNHFLKLLPSKLQQQFSSLIIGIIMLKCYRNLLKAKEDN